MTLLTSLVLAAFYLTQAVPLNTLQPANIGCKALTDLLQVVDTHVKFGRDAAVSLWKEKIDEKKCINTGDTSFQVKVIELVHDVDIPAEGVTIEVYKTEFSDGTPWYVPVFIKLKKRPEA